eukprot:UN21149
MNFLLFSQFFFLYCGFVLSFDRHFVAEIPYSFYKYQQKKIIFSVIRIAFYFR